MQAKKEQRVRCPCCGEIYLLTSDMYLVDEPVAELDAFETRVATDALVPIKLVFDGGSNGNPGAGYGSYQLTVRGKPETPKRLKFGPNYTNNEAEYDTLIAALEAIIKRAKDPRRVQLDIRGDSQLVIKQITGAWKIKEPRMLERVRQVHALLQQLGEWRATWHDRSKSVEALGH